MSEEGTASLSLREIARRMGISAPALYNYYKNRDDLVTSLIVEAYNSLADALELASAAWPSEQYGQRFLAVSLAFREWSLAYKVQFFLIFGTPIPGYHAPGEITIPAAWRVNASFLLLLENAWNAGRLTIPAEYAALALPLYAELGDWMLSQGLNMPPALLHLALAGWGQIQGLVSLELYGQFDYLGGDIGDLYRVEVTAYVRRLGLL
jgi:AcrR family transcriptional regulator